MTRAQVETALVGAVALVLLIAAGVTAWCTPP
jgi:hypothetical protein